MVAKEKSLWVQVMEAGFGATLEAHGFRRVSPRLYRLEGDGITWEQLTYRGFKEYPNCIREGHGAIVAGSEELFRKAFGDNPREFGLSAFCHHLGGRRYNFPGTIADTHDWKEREDNQARRPKTRLGKIWRIFRRDPFVPLDRKTRYFFQHHKAEGGSWHLFDLSTEELAELMSRYWVEYVWNWYLSKRLTLYNLSKLDFSDESLNDGWGHYCAIYNFLAGRPDTAMIFIADRLRNGDMTLDEIRRDAEKNRSPALQDYSEDNPDRELKLADICRSRKQRYERLALQARRLAAAMDLKV